jgi:hypothetical protein
MHAANAEVTDAFTRAAARNGLGNVHAALGDDATAADEYLAAATAFAALPDPSGLVSAQTNAAAALLRAGRVDDAKAVARETLPLLGALPHLGPRLAPTLNEILAAPA